jgi:beta-glucanase (GH16 family)
MKLRLWVALLCWGTTSLQADPPEGAKWTPIPEFTDEFDAKELDLKKWQRGNPTWRGREPGLFMDHNISLQNGKLLLKMQAETLVNAPAGYHDFSCASVTSRNRIRYGYFEMKAKIMASKGASAFWFFNNTPELWTEIDVFEMCAGGSKEAGKIHTNVHVMHGPGISKELALPESFLMPDDPSQNFHIYGLEWDLSFIRWYLNGKLVRKQENTHWRQTLYLLFDTEVMDPWFGIPDKATLPSVYEIDYIRAWQKRG